MRQIEDTINDARNLSGRLLPPPALGTPPPYPPGGIPTAVDRDRDVHNAYDQDGNPLDPRVEEIHDFSDLIDLVQSLQSDAMGKQESIKHALKTITNQEADLAKAQGNLTNVEETQRYANEQYDTLMDPDHTGHHLTMEQAEHRYERRQRNRRIGAAIGGAATYLAAYFGGGALISAGFDAAFVGPDSWFNTGMNYLTNDIIEPMTKTPWWQKWF
jgi:hypothetical protein